MFLLICTLNILVIKQHLCKPIVKSILIGTKISQVVELQLKRVASKSPYQSRGDAHQMREGHQIWAEQQCSEQLTAVPSKIWRHRFVWGEQGSLRFSSWIAVHFAWAHVQLIKSCGNRSKPCLCLCLQDSSWVCRVSLGRAVELWIWSTADRVLKPKTEPTKHERWEQRAARREQSPRNILCTRQWNSLARVNQVWASPRPAARGAGAVGGQLRHAREVSGSSWAASADDGQCPALGRGERNPSREC